jgi:NAD(P)-dependent dehydrogenase (short-subunit alcohol dehydrogenase family)
MNTTNKIALITGGSRGLGKDMALNIAKKGNDVIITYNNSEAEANDTGSVVAFLCSDESKWVNGQRIEVSGGINV